MSLNRIQLHVAGPHSGQPVFLAGEPLNQAQAALILLHGRGASAADMLDFAGQFHRPGLAVLAPQAAGSVWYPQRLTAPYAQNEPWLSSALEITAAAAAAAEQAGIAAEHLILIGFSQGASLALEYAARRGGRMGGLAALSGGVIGADGEPRQDAGALAGTPVLLGCSDVDPYIPLERVQYSAQVLAERGASVDLRIYPGMGHTINQDELGRIEEMISAVMKKEEKSSQGL